MKILLTLAVAATILSGCKKDDSLPSGCNMDGVYADNANKVTIANGVWGTVSFMEGDCMPGSVGTCKHCPVRRTVKIYQYALFNNATPQGSLRDFYTDFNTPLVAQLSTDDAGFFQTELPPGHYSLAVVENGKLYVSFLDGYGGLNPFTITTGNENVNITMTYKASF